jgi:D-alanine--poly(phosphoribitol) ligase subunit 1
VEYVAWILALIKNDIPFVPTDTIYPQERINAIITQTESQVLIDLSEDSLTCDIPLRIHRNGKVSTYKTPDFNDKCYGAASNPLRYIIFTSGSTGSPKGVMISKKAFESFLKWLQTDYQFTSEDVFLNPSVFSFDLSFYDLFISLQLGATILTAARTHYANQDELINLLQKYRCTVWTSTPSFAYLFLKNKNFNSNNLSEIHRFLFIGESLPKNTVFTIEKLFPAARIQNAYGPTEATVSTTVIDVDSQLITHLGEVPLGYAIPSGIIKIDGANEEGIGEIIIAGPHVADGYFKNDELTAQKFKFNTIPQYYTGDLGVLKEGILFFRGRTDTQIKFHGYRIELEEIASRLKTFEEVEEAVIITLNRNGEIRKLVGIIQLNSKIFPENICAFFREKLTGSLPEYMIPSDFVQIKSWPLNTNHKIDRNKLTEFYLSRSIG